MKKILVVDDVPIIVESIKKILKEEYEVEVLEANDGEEALIKLEHEKPDLLVTDIKMPNKDGIKLIEEVRKKDSHMPIVIISGFKEFEYAEKALNMGVVGYIVKPISKNQLYAVVEKAFKIMDENRMKRQLTTEVRQMKKHQTREMQEGILYNFLVNKNPEQQIQKIDLLGNGYYGLYMIKLLDDHSKQLGFTKQDYELIEESVKNIVVETLEEYNPLYIKHKLVESCSIVCLQNEKEIVLNYNIENLAKDLYKKVKSLLGINMRIGISAIHSKLEKELYSEALMAIQHLVINPQKYIHAYTSQVDSNKSVDTLMDSLEIYIKSGEYKKVETILNKIFDQSNKYIQSVQQLKYTLSCIYTFIYETSEKQVKIYIEGEFLNDKYLLQVTCLEEIKQNILDQIKYIFYLKGISTEDCYKSNIEEYVHNYIEQHMDENIRIKDLADLCGIHYNYFSSLFKKLTNKSAVQYITDIKMKKAIKLLEEGNEVIAEIALMVGYTDIQYFYKTFKKYTGKTPLAYRNKN